jgi:uncharacterized protein YqeY
MSIESQIKADVNAAMKAKDRERVTALRVVLAEIQKDVKEGLGDEQAVLRRERKRRRDAEQAFREGGRDDLADKEAGEAKLIEVYLPAALSEDELEQLIKDAIAATGAESPRDMGKVIKHAMSAAQGRAEGAQVSARAKEALAT